MVILWCELGRGQWGVSLGNPKKHLSSLKEPHLPQVGHDEGMESSKTASARRAVCWQLYFEVKMSDVIIFKTHTLLRHLPLGLVLELHFPPAVLPWELLQLPVMLNKVLGANYPRTLSWTIILEDNYRCCDVPRGMWQSMDQNFKALRWQRESLLSPKTAPNQHI